MFLVRTSRVSLKFAATSATLFCSSRTTFLLCWPSWSWDLGCEECCCEVRDWRPDIWVFRRARSCLMTKVSSLISTGRSSNMAFFLATGPACQYCSSRRGAEASLHCANLSSFPMVAVIPLPIAAASRANCERALLGAASPLASCFCCCDKRDCRCCVVGAFCRFCACARIVLNSLVRSCIDVTIFGL